MTIEIGRIITDRFELRPLVERDATNRYLNWLRDESTKKYINAASETENLSDLQSYIRDRSGRGDVLFLGIFDKENGLHIGNIKYEPINSEFGYAVMGILIGDPEYRGKGVFSEVIRASADRLKLHFGVSEIVLGVSKENTAAIHAYKKVGFVARNTPYIAPGSGTTTMVWAI